MSRAATLLLMACVASTVATPAIDPDMWWHLRAGEAFLRDGVPSGDIFSFTAPGRSWVTQEWLIEIIMWTLWRIGEMPLLIVFFGAVVTAAFWLLVTVTDARRHIAALVALCGALVAAGITGVRTQMIDLLGLAVLVWILERIRTGRTPQRAIWLIVPLLTLWSNLHAGYLAGIALLVVYAIGERLDRRAGSAAVLPDRAITVLPVVILLALFAAAINPNGFEMWTYPVETLQTDSFQQNIAEWQSPNFQDASTWPFLAAVIVCIFAFTISNRRRTWTAVLLLMGTALAGLQSIRHTQLFALLLAPYATPHIQAAWDQLRQGKFEFPELVGSRALRGVVYAAAPLLVLVMYAAAFARHDDGVIDGFPVGAVEAVLADEHLPSANVFNEYSWGGYLIWNDIPVFIDGRADMYGDEFFERYLQAVRIEPDWSEALDLHDVGYAILPNDAPLVTLMDTSDEWTVAYDDGQAAVVLRCPDGQFSTDRGPVDCPVLSPG